MHDNEPLFIVTPAELELVTGGNRCDELDPFAGVVCEATKFVADYVEGVWNGFWAS